MSLPLVALMAGGSWFWLQQRRTRPLLTGTLRRVAAPALVGATIPLQLDLDNLNRREISLGATPGAYLQLPDAVDQPTPTVRLIGQLDPDDQLQVTLVAPGTTDTEPVQVNNVPVSSEWMLRDGDVITLGVYRFKYENLRQRGLPYGDRRR